MAMIPVTVSAPAKVNLYLHVTGRRDDGYHLLDSLVAFAPDIADRVSITPSPSFSFSLSGPMAKAIEPEDQSDNLAVRAARLYCDTVGLRPAFALHLEKNIPAGAGLGGGSADAAAVIRALEQFYGQSLPGRERNLLLLGADVPVCYHGQACRFEGVGDIITQAPALPALSILLVWPARHSATKDVFALRNKGFSSAVHMPESFGNTQQFITFLTSTGNDLKDAASTLSPEIDEAEQMVRKQAGCLLSRMSGSGSAVAGLFETADACRRAAAAIQAVRPLWWVRDSAVS